MQKLKHEPAYYETTKFKWRQRIGFGISDYACNLAYLLANTYLLFYYTNCAGLAAGAVGFMFVVTKFIDAFTDYMVGAMIDRTDTKMGRGCSMEHRSLQLVWFCCFPFQQDGAQVQNLHGHTLLTLSSHLVTLW